MRGHGAGGSRTVHCASRGKLQLGSRVAVAAALVAAAPGAATLGAAAVATIAFAVSSLDQRLLSSLEDYFAQLNPNL